MITPMRVFVLIFNVGTDNEGIHSIRVGDRDKILMFESEDDATRFALMLEAQDFHAPTVEPIDAEEIKEFCISAGHEWEIIPVNSNFVVTPPEANMTDTDWQPEVYKQDIDEDSFSPPPIVPTEAELSNSELESIRRRLEGLL